MVDRQIVQIPEEQVKKLKELEKIRKDLAGYPISKKVHILLQEKLRAAFQGKDVIENPEKDEWVEYIRDVLPTHIFGVIAIGITKYSKEMIGVPFTKVLVASEGDKTWWCNYNEDIKNIGKYLIENFKNKRFAEEYFLKYDLIIDEFREKSKKVRKEDFSKLSKNKLLAKYNEFSEDFMKVLALTFDIDAIDICLERKIKEKFTKLTEFKKLSKREFSSKYSLLTSPTSFSYVNAEETRLLKVVKEIKEKNFEEDPIIKDKINELVKDFWWTSLGWTQRKENNFETYVIKIKEILKNKKDVSKELINMNKSLKKIRKDKEKLASEYNFDDEMNFYLDIFEKYVVLHDYRKEDQMRGTSIMNKFLFELEKRDGVPYDDLVWAWPDEIREYIQVGKIDLEKIRERKGAFLVIVEKDNIKQYIGEEAIKIRKKSLMEDEQAIQDFEGTSASLGKVTGRVKVCYSSADAIKKIEKGDILVASMTLPDYVPAMKKASAIVTDEGGVTCHAAIVAREFGIPCLVGTKIATRVLKDNDLIEVNANHGRVKILKRE